MLNCTCTCSATGGLISVGGLGSGGDGKGYSYGCAVGLLNGVPRNGPSGELDEMSVIVSVSACCCGSMVDDAGALEIDEGSLAVTSGNDESAAETTVMTRASSVTIPTGSATSTFTSPAVAVTRCERARYFAGRSGGVVGIPSELTIGSPLVGDDASDESDEVVVVKDESEEREDVSGGGTRPNSNSCILISILSIVVVILLYVSRVGTVVICRLAEKSERAKGEKDGFSVEYK